MEFKVIDVPSSAPTYGQSSPIVDALLTNIGKAVEVPTESIKDASTLRKTVRAVLTNRNHLFDKKFRTQIARDGRSIIMWLEVGTPDPNSVID